MDGIDCSLLVLWFLSVNLVDDVIRFLLFNFALVGVLIKYNM